jgi:hypothetical protein
MVSAIFGAFESERVSWTVFGFPSCIVNGVLEIGWNHVQPDIEIIEIIYIKIADIFRYIALSDIFIMDLIRNTPTIFPIY